jgi:hypothetical protein
MNHFWIIAQGVVTVHLKNHSDNIDEGDESTCLKLVYQDTTVEDFEQTPSPIITSISDFEQFEQTPTPIITSTRTSGTKFEFNTNSAQSNQTVANYIIKNIRDTLRTADTSSRTEYWLIAIFTLIFVTFVMSAINLYKQCKIVSYSYSFQNLFLLLLHYFKICNFELL